jgi:hypothetical protein
MYAPRLAPALILINADGAMATPPSADGERRYSMPSDRHERPDLVGQGSVNRSNERL